MSCGAIILLWALHDQGVGGSNINFILLEIFLMSRSEYNCYWYVCGCVCINVIEIKGWWISKWDEKGYSIMKFELIYWFEAIVFLKLEGIKCRLKTQRFFISCWDMYVDCNLLLRLWDMHMDHCLVIWLHEIHDPRVWGDGI